MQKQSQRDWYVRNRQRILEVRKQYYKENRKICDERTVKWNAKHPQQRRQIVKKCWDKNYHVYITRKLARNAVQAQVRKKYIIKPTKCEICGKRNKHIQAHHYNGYDAKNRLNVIWICKRCHQSFQKPW